MQTFNQAICYLGPEQLQSKFNLKPLKAFSAADVTLQLYANVYDRSVEAVLGDEDAYVAAVEKILEGGRQKLARLAAKQHADWPVEVVWDRTGKEWIEDNQVDFDLVIMFGQRDGANYSLPSEWSVLRHLERPLYVVSPDKKAEREVVLAAVDIANTDQAPLNDAVMAAAATMARQRGAKLHMVTVIPMSALVADLEFVDRDKYREGFIKKHGETLSALASAHGVGDEDIHMSIGIPHEVIRKTAKKLKVQMTVVGTVQRTGVPGFVFGNTVERLLGRSQHDVLVVPSVGAG